VRENVIQGVNHSLISVNHIIFVFRHLVIFCGFLGTPYTEEIICSRYAFYFCLSKKIIISDSYNFIQFGYNLCITLFLSGLWYLNLSVLMVVSFTIITLVNLAHHFFCYLVSDSYACSLDSVCCIVFALVYFLPVRVAFNTTCT
jgi:hypothetical protein